MPLVWEVADPSLAGQPVDPAPPDARGKRPSPPDLEGGERGGRPDRQSLGPLELGAPSSGG